jgi:hypothetical protein
MKFARKRTSLWAALAMGGVLAACSSNITDTVYSGRWERGQDTFSHSIVAIWNENGEYRFRVDRYHDGAHELRCPPEGACAIYDGDAPVYELVFQTKFDEQQDALFVDCAGTPLDGKSTPVHWVERVTVTPDGSELLVQRVELNHQPRTDGPRRFRKTSDNPFR